MKDQREIIIPDLDYQAEVRKCKTMEDVVGKNGLMQKLFKDIIQQLLEAEMDIVLKLLKVVLVKLA